ncbi:hypothetical protein BC629DRAFT_1501015 [Irpex lacteus]|nr:hypothetical protein BC629DRAFT_1501015 [Irpex lacteus]
MNDLSWLRFAGVMHAAVYIFAAHICWAYHFRGPSCTGNTSDRFLHELAPIHSRTETCSNAVVKQHTSEDRPSIPHSSHADSGRLGVNQPLSSYLPQRYRLR